MSQGWVPQRCYPEAPHPGPASPVGLASGQVKDQIHMCMLVRAQPPRFSGQAKAGPAVTEEPPASDSSLCSSGRSPGEVIPSQACH